MTAPKMMLASGCAASLTKRAASLISNSPRSLPPEIESRTPCAPSIPASSNGLEMAFSAASTARSSPRAEPIPMRADPAPCMMLFTSAKSRLIRPGVVIRSVIPDTPWSNTWSACRNASITLILRSDNDSKRSFGITIKVSTSARRLSIPVSACA